MAVLSLLLLALAPAVVSAFIPAHSVNSTALLNLTDTASSIDFVWVEGTYNARLSLQLTADPGTSEFFPNEYASAGVDRGALVHFSEDLVKGNETSTTPWIAFISCDSNTTTMSLEDDIFTLARDRGANAALLYSNTSAGCEINADYLERFEKPLDVFATRSRDDAVLIESQFGHTAGSFYGYDAALLNASFQSVTTLLNRTYPAAQTYVVAILAAYNATGTVGDVVPTATAGVEPLSGSGGGGGGGGGGAGRSLAMIILYVIAGFIILIVFLVIYKGARRAARQPDLYGPRAAASRGYPYNFDEEGYDAFRGAGAGGPEVQAQTRTQGLARAIVDSFPLVKFTRRDAGRGSAGGVGSEREGGREAGAADGGRPGHGRRFGSASGKASLASAAGGAAGAEALALEPLRPTPSRRTSSSSEPLPSAGAGKGESGTVEVLPAPSFASTSAGARGEGSTAGDSSSVHSTACAGVGVGAGGGLEEGHLTMEEDEEHCAICLLAFEDDDDLRVLPCEGAHQFHKDCVDQWLLEVSSSCPLCRKDFSQATAAPPLTSPSTSSLPLHDPSRAGSPSPRPQPPPASTSTPSATAVSASAPPAAPSRSRIQGFLRRVRSARALHAPVGGRAARRPAVVDGQTLARQQHALALNSAGLY